MRTRLLSFCLITSFTISTFLQFAASASGQVRPVNDYGAMGLAQLLKRLQTTGSVMMVGAHPDDEDSALLAYLARGESARTAYLSLTRGDGGQNIIGPELFEALGIIRTEELLQARRLDGAEQYFTRAYDYGFSKTLSEAKSKWPEDVIKCDVVHAIRLFRPLVVISRFTGTPRDGHGQHQYAGYITPLAVKAAADPQQCTGAGEAWTVKKFYIESGFQDNAEPTLRINTGQYDPILGRTYFEIAMEGRSQHRSQGEGRIEFHGDSFSGLNLVGAAKDVREKDIFEGLDTTLSGIPKTYASVANAPGPTAPDATIRELNAAQLSAEQSLHDFDFEHPSKILPILLAGWESLGRGMRNDSGVDVSVAREVSQQRKLFTDTIEKAIGLQIDALADAETVVPGESITASVRVYFPKSSAVTVKKIDVDYPTAWSSVALDERSDANPQRRETANGTARFRIDVPRDWRPTQPYWLEETRDGDLFRWPADVGLTTPFSRPQRVAAVVTLDVGGQTIEFAKQLQYRYADPARGEVRRNVDVVPRLSINVDPELIIVPLSVLPEVRKVTVTTTNNSSSATAGVVSLNIGSPGVRWPSTPNTPAFAVKAKGETVSIPFEVTIPAGTRAGRYHIQGRASAVGSVSEETMFGLTMNTVAYAHIQTHRYYTPAATNVLVLDLKTVPVNVGYIMGSGDEVPDAIRQMGLSVTMIDDLATADLSKFDTIVVGIRASETRPDFVANNKRLLDYVSAGGSMIVQYQRGNWTGLAPFPVNTQDRQGTTAGSIARVVDENAPVAILDPQNPVFNFPNKISDSDFAGWVQERNAYNLVTFDPKYTPLLESHDPGEQPNNGGMVLARLGKGTYIYTSYSWFRQLPAGVPGAYRIFANLLSLSKASKNP